MTWVSDEKRDYKTKAVGDYVLLKSRQQAGVRNEGKIISNLYRCRYQVLSLGGNANAKLSFTVKDGSYRERQSASNDSKRWCFHCRSGSF